MNTVSYASSKAPGAKDSRERCDRHVLVQPSPCARCLSTALEYLERVPVKMLLNVSGTEFDVNQSIVSTSELLKGLGGDGLEDDDVRVPVPREPHSFEAWMSGLTACKQTPTALFEAIKVQIFCCLYVLAHHAWSSDALRALHHL